MSVPFEINEPAPYIYDPYGYQDDEDRDVAEIDPLRPDPYPFTPLHSGEAGYVSPESSGQPSGYHSGPYSQSGSGYGYNGELQAAGTDPAPTAPLSTAVAGAGAAGVMTKLDIERRRSTSVAAARARAQAPLGPEAIQDEDAGFVQDGEVHIPPQYRPEWEAAQRERLGRV